jgi:hypothetical protein
MLDATFLFQNFEEWMDEEQRKVGRALANDFIKFLNRTKLQSVYNNTKSSAKKISLN